MWDVVMGFTGWLWGTPLIVLIVGTSVILSIRLKFFQFGKFGYIIKNTIGKREESTGEGNLTPFQAVSAALAGCIGTGNIAGVGVAIATGGPGAVFWMWFVALLVMITKYTEITLGVKYREKDPETGLYRGGFMYMVTNYFGQKWKPLAIAWSFLFFIQFAISGAVQANAITDVMRTTFNANELVIGIILAVLVGIVIIGGIKRIGQLAEKVIPAMATLYIVAAIIVLALNIPAIPEMFKLIFTSAFTGMAPVGGFTGSAISIMISAGFARGIYSNEGGMGTAPFAHATAQTDHPAKQGLWGVFEVFIDTIIVCTATALVILVTGAWESGASGAGLTATAFSEGMPGGGVFITLATAIFAYTTILMAQYYSEIGGIYCFGNKISKPHRILYMLVIVGGAVGGLEVIWGLMDTFMGLTVAINLVVLLMMSGEAVRLTEEYFSGAYLKQTNK